LTALRNSTPEAVQEALAPLGNVEVTAVNGWCWFSSSVWGVASSKILAALADFDGPLLLATTEDACRWYLQLRSKDQESYVAVHDFPPCQRSEGEYDYQDLNRVNEEDCEEESEELTFGAPPIPESDLPPLAFTDPFFEPYEEDEEDFDEEEEYDELPLASLCEGYASLGLPLSDSIIAQLSTVPDDQLQETFLEIHATEIHQALDRFGITHERQVVIDILCGRSVTSVEMDWDIGNLPRFLHALGLGPHFEKMVEDAEREEKQLADQEPENFAHPVIKAMAGVTTEPLIGGPVSVPIEESPLLFRAGYYTNEDMVGAFQVRLPGKSTFQPTDRVPRYLSVHEVGGELEIGVSDKDVFLSTTSFAKLGTLLGALPDAAELTLHLISKTVPSQQFRGSVRDGHWHIESTTPPLPADALVEAIALFEAPLAQRHIMAQDDTEARSILEAARTDYTLSDSPPTQDGLAISVRSSHRNNLAILYFRHRFGNHWDCSAAIAENEHQLQEWNKFSKTLDAAERLPTTEKVLLEGQASKFYEADMETASRDEEFSIEIEKLPVLRKAFAALGFEHLGAMVCEKIGKCIICGFVNQGQDAFAVHYIMPFGITSKDCYTPFEDGTSLTTTTVFDEGSIAKLRILKHFCESQRPGSLVENHRKGQEILRKYGIEKAIIDPSIEGLARAMDGFLLKRLTE